jgi:hypothetical protein
MQNSETVFRSKYTERHLLLCNLLCELLYLDNYILCPLLAWLLTNLLHATFTSRDNVFHMNITHISPGHRFIKFKFSRSVVKMNPVIYFTQFPCDAAVVSLSIHS